MRKILYIGLTFVLMVAAAAGGYFYGNKTGSARALAQRAAFVAQRGGGGFFGGAGGQQPGATGGTPRATQPRLAGTISSVEDDRLELSTQDGTVTVIVNDQTVISRMDTLKAADLKSGEQAVVFGDRDVQGNLVARSLQVGNLSRSQQ